LGAGASWPFGFPLGRGLLQNVVSEIQRQSEFYHRLTDCGFSPRHLQEFARDLLLSAQPSVDAFLENRPEFLDAGKAAIAAALIPIEDESRLHRPVGIQHWYEYLFNQLGPTRADYEQSRLSIVTFNYDRSFEHFLFLALKASFGLSVDECKALLRVVPLVHVHGQLGALDYDSPDGRPYRPDLNRDVILKCMKEIKVVHEGQPDDPQFRQAHDLLRVAEVVCFLGFGYLGSNLERLRLDFVPAVTIVYGCATGKTETEVNIVQHQGIFTRFERRAFGKGGDEDVLTFLRNKPVFL
jgi:hypothetical protein